MTGHITRRKLLAESARAGLSLVALAEIGGVTLDRKSVV